MNLGCALDTYLSSRCKSPFRCVMAMLLLIWDCLEIFPSPQKFILGHLSLGSQKLPIRELYSGGRSCRSQRNGNTEVFTEVNFLLEGSWEKFLWLALFLESHKFSSSWGKQGGGVLCRMLRLSGQSLTHKKFKA